MAKEIYTTIEFIFESVGLASIFLRRKLAPLLHRLGVRSESFYIFLRGVELYHEFGFGFLEPFVAYLQASLWSDNSSIS